MSDRGRDAVRAPLFVALSCVGLLSSPALAEASANAAEGSAQSNVERPDTIVITGERAQHARVESPKATSELLDTPQTITVVTAEQLKRQNLLSLRDVLTTLPGITFGAGEGGGGYGDAINLRGYSANNDITVDGVRDSAQYSRTDPFNLQQIEIYNGANSVFGGAGSVGGTINLVSKVPQSNSSTTLTGGVGTNDYWRATVDTNQQLGDGIALRVNGMAHRNDYSGRDVERFRRWGIAPAATVGIGRQTSLTLAYVHQYDDNIPLYGVPYIKNQINDGPLPGAHRSDYFGYRHFDRQEITVDRLTATLQHDFNPHLSLRNLARWQRVHQNTVATAPQGVFCLETTGRQPVLATANGTQGAACTNGLLPGQFLITGPHGRERDQVNRLLYNQTDLRLESGDKGRLHNILVVGAQLSHEEYGIDTIEVMRTADGSAAPLDIDIIADPAGSYDGPVNPTITARSKSRTTNYAAYVFDTLEIGPMFELNGGVRIEEQDAVFRNLALDFVPPGTVPLTPLQLQPQRSKDTLFSYRVGAVFKPTPNTSLYASFANARTPTSATVRLGCGVLASPGAPDPCAAAPETARNYEIGAKANVLGGKLQLTAALFRNERSNFRVPSNDPSNPTQQVVDGRARVDGIALGAAGNLTHHWSIFANYTYLDSEVLQSVSDYCLANPSALCANSAAIRDPQRGDELIQTPHHSGSLFTTYQLPFGLQVGYGFTYQGAFALNQRNVNFRRQIRSDDFLIHRLYLAYELQKGLLAQVNVQNFTNERYFTNIRNNVSAAGIVTGGWAVPGDGPSATLTVSYGF
jgi:catecholate siderophore receptor